MSSSNDQLLIQIASVLSIISKDMHELKRDISNISVKLDNTTETLQTLLSNQESLHKSAFSLESKLMNQLHQLSNPSKKFYTRLGNTPIELVHCILAWIHPSKVFKYRRVSKTFNQILSSRHFAEQNLNHHSSKANSIDSERTSATEFDHLYFHCPEKYQDVYARHHLSHLALIYWSDESFQNSPKLPPSLGTLQQLCFLHLSGSNISGEIPEALFELASLEELDLGGNMLSGGLSQNIGKMQSLVCLSLDGNLLSGSIPDEVGSLSHLKQLDLSENAFSGKIPSSFGNLKNLIYLFLNNNQIEGGVPAEMFGLAQLRHFMANDNRLQFVIGYEAVRGFANLDVWDMSNNISVTSDLFQRGNYRGGWFF